MYHREPALLRHRHTVRDKLFNVWVYGGIIFYEKRGSFVSQGINSGIAGERSEVEKFLLVNGPGKSCYWINFICAIPYDHGYKG